MGSQAQPECPLDERPLPYKPYTLTKATSPLPVGMKKNCPCGPVLRTSLSP